jgi:cyclic di-GMP phosphodiesterase
MTERDNRRILIIDDNEAIHEDFKKILCPGNLESATFSEAKTAFFGQDNSTTPQLMEKYVLDSAYQGKDGFELVQKSLKDKKPFAMAFVDVRMPPGWDGIETVKNIWNIDPELQIVLCTAFSDYSTNEITSTLEHQGNLLIIKKPFDSEEVCLAAISLTKKWNISQENHHYMSSLESMIEERTNEITTTRDAIVYSLARLAESRDKETGEHLARIRIFSQILAEELAGVEPYKQEISDTFLNHLFRATPLHDVGKVGIPDHILLKPGKLTKEEFEIMKTHTSIGYETLKETSTFLPQNSFLHMAAEIARSHHEWYDGSGYPDGLKGNDIPLSARILAVADVFDALTSKRVYKDAMSDEEACRIIKEETGTHFDPIIANVFMECLEFILVEKKRINRHTVTQPITSYPGIN